MAWRICEHVLRGEIDNRMRGRVTGRIWLAGIMEPLALDLRGDCQPDLAGCLLRFENPNARALTTRPPAFQQSGAAGDITAARKVRVYDVPVASALAMVRRGQTPPEHRANALYMEWFSALSGRVVIESAEYHLEVSEPEWRFTREELVERERRASEGATAFAAAVDADGKAEEWDEFRNEQQLRESDMLGEKYRRLLEKYAGHPDSERIIAREMGWSWLEEALDAQVEAQASPGEEDFSVEEFDSEKEPRPDPAREGIDWVWDAKERIVHPISKHARDALYALLDELNVASHFPDCDDPALTEFVGHFMTLSAKLAGALGGLARGGYEPDRGLVIAWLKRALDIHNQTLLAAKALADSPFLAGESVAHHRAELFAIREEILALISRLRGQEA
jgi:hypothetical protein